MQKMFLIAKHQFEDLQQNYILYLFFSAFQKKFIKFCTKLFYIRDLSVDSLTNKTVAFEEMKIPI